MNIQLAVNILQAIKVSLQRQVLTYTTTICLLLAGGYLSSAVALIPPATTPSIGSGRVDPLSGQFDGTTIWVAPLEFETASWVSRYSLATSAVVESFGKPIRISHSTDITSIRLGVETFLADNAYTLAIAGTTPVIMGVGMQNDYIVSVQLNINGIPIESAIGTMSINQNGALNMIRMRGVGSNVMGTFNKTQSEAELIARQSVSAEIQTVKAEKVYFPVVQESGMAIALVPAYRFTISTVSPALQPVIWVSAVDGSILASENRVWFSEANGLVRGTVHPFYGKSPVEDRNFRHAHIKVAGDTLFSDRDGSYLADPDGDYPLTMTTKLRGKYVLVREMIKWDEQGISMKETKSQSRQIISDESDTAFWSDAASTLAERDLFHSVNAIHDYWKSVEPGSNKMDYPILAVSNMGGEGVEEYQDNAFSSEQGIFFGRGLRLDNFAYYADVVYHEYTHTLTGKIYAGKYLPYAGQPGAMNEAWSDYFSCSFTNESKIGEGGLVGNSWLRILDNGLKWPQDTTGEVHDDSRILSAAMWDTRRILGAQLSDSLLHFARYRYSSSFSSYLLDVLLTDDDNGDITDGSPNYRTIYEQFGKHGITLSIPHFTFADFELVDDTLDGAKGDGDYLFEPGETLRLPLTIFRTGITPAQADKAIYLSVQCDNPDVSADTSRINLGRVQVGERFATSSAVLLNIKPDAGLGYATVYLTVTDSDGKNPVQDSIRFLIGVPSILIYRDGDTGADHTLWYRKALDSAGFFYAPFKVAGEGQTLLDKLSEFEYVIWFTGDSTAGVLDEEERNAITTYVGNGGNVILSGQTIGHSDELRGWIRELFGAEHTADSLKGRVVKGVADDVIGQGLTYLLLGDGGARNQYIPKGIQAVGDAQPFLMWDRTNGNPSAAVWREHQHTGGKTIYCSFGLEAISPRQAQGFAPLSGLLSAMFDWFDAPMTNRSETLLPTAFTVSEPFPNPFNSSVAISYHLPSATEFSLTVTDISGRLLETIADGSTPAGRHTVIWSARNYGTGTYFLRFTSARFSSVKKVVLVK